MARKRPRKNKHRSMTRRRKTGKKPMSPENKLAAKLKREEVIEKAKKNKKK